MRCKPISRVSTTSRLLVTRLKKALLLSTRRCDNNNNKFWWWWNNIWLYYYYLVDVFLARIFFARIASRVQMVSSGFVNGDYLIRNADWLAKGNPLGVKLHVRRSKTRYHRSTRYRRTNVVSRSHDATRVFVGLHVLIHLSRRGVARVFEFTRSLSNYVWKVLLRGWFWS